MTAIQEGDSDGNEKTVGDPDWQPLINTLNYPDYTSGADNFTGAVTTILRLFFGTDEFNFTVTSNSPLVTTKTRTFSRFPEAADEVVEAREAFFLGATVASGLGGASDCGDRPQDWPPKGHLQVVGAVPFVAGGFFYSLPLNANCDHLCLSGRGRRWKLN